MATDFQQLVQDFYDYFINLYRNANEGGAAEAFLAFEPIGTAITPEMFVLQTGEFSPILALEQFSSLANTLPILEGTTIKAPSIRTVDGLYDLIVVSAQPIPSADRAPFDKFRSAADEAFDRAIMPPLISTGRRYCPAVATPPDWCSPQGLTNWPSKSFTSTEKTETTTQSGTPPPANPVSKRNWQFRVLPTALAPAVENASAMQRVLPQLQMMSSQEVTPVETSPDSVFMRQMKLSREVTPVETAAAQTQVLHTRARRISAMPAPLFQVAAQLDTPAVSAARVAFVHPVLTERVQSPANKELALAAVAANRSPAVNFKKETNESTMFVRSDILAAQSQALNAAASSQEVTSKTLSLSFDYCLVTITRPWVSTEFLSIKSWYLPGSKAGDISSGTGSGDAPFEVMPVAALVVKNLKIKADWSHSDQASIQDSVAMGPFSLVGRSIDSVSGELTCLGMQIVGWVCEPMPMLPPASDPAVV